MMMKKIYILFLLVISSISFAQTRADLILKKQNELKEKQLREGKQNGNNSANTTFNQSQSGPVIYSDSKEYANLKNEGKLAHYEIRMREAGKPIVLSSTAKTSTANPTPCDYIPYVGPALSFGGADDYNTTVALPFSFCFYGNNYTSCNVSINGNIQFSTNSTAFSSTGFPSNTVNMIAPFWADCYLTSGSSVKVDVFPTRIVVSWDSMGYFNNHNDKTNSFQCVITNGIDGILPPGKNVGFYYKKMQWTTGDASSGVNGFPNPTVNPAIPATVGINQGNGVDYYLIGRFGKTGVSYDGPLGADDGVAWLNGKRFYFNACPPVGSNLEPIPTLIGYCDTLKVCGNDTLYVKNTFLAPEVNQNVSITAVAPTLGSAFTFSTIPNQNSSDIYMIVDGSVASGGYHTITMTATDNGTPAQTSTQNFIIYVNQAAINNLNGTIITTPNIGACPGAVVGASVTVNGGVPDSYLWSNNQVGSSTTFTTVLAADSLIFVTLQSGQCKKTIIGDININPVPVASVTGNLSYCNGDTSRTILTIANTLNPNTQGPHTYNWATTNGNLSSTTSPTVAVTGGVYTATVTNQFGCKSIVTTTVTMKESPSYTLASSNAISGGSVYCVSQDTARLGLSFATSSTGVCGLANSPCTVSNTVQIGTTNNNSSATATSPFANLWGNTRHQYLYRASELTAGGLVAGKISSLSFGVQSVFGLATYPNFTVKIKCTSANVTTTTFDNTGLTQVYSANTTIAPGVVTLNFTQPYIWDGVSNILIDVCHSINPWTNSSSVYYTNTGFNSVTYDYDDYIQLCGSALTAITSQNRPSVRFGNCLAQQTASQFNIVVTPTTGVVIPASKDSLFIDLPSTSGVTCYTVTLNNPIGGCFKDTVICVNATQGVTQATLSPSSASICPSNSVTLTANGALTSYTITYVDGTGIHTSVNAPATFTPIANAGSTHIYTLSAIGPCGGSLTDFTTSVSVMQGITQATLSASSLSICPGNTITLSPIGALDSYTITYEDGTGIHTSANSPITFTPIATFGSHTYTLSGNGPCGGPLTDFTTSITTIQGVTQATLSASTATICSGDQITLTSIGALDTYTITYEDATGIHTSINTQAVFTPISSFGIHTYTLSGIGPCSGPLTDFTTSVTTVQGVTNSTLSATPNAVCIGSPVTLNALGTIQSYTIQYNNGSGVVSSINSPATFNTTTAGVITYSLISHGFCSAPTTTVVTTVTVTALANLSVTPMSNKTVCIGGNSVLTANVVSSTPGNPGTPYTYNWTTLPGNIPAAGVNNQSTYNANVNNTTIYQVSVSGVCAAPTTASVIISTFVNNLSVAIIDSASVCAESEFALTAAVSGGRPGYSFEWFLSPNLTSISSTNPLSGTAPTSEGTYTVSVMVTDSCGYTSGNYQLINVLPPCDIVIPNIITPNGDGVNEYFVIKNLEYHSNCVFSVFDRWGKKVYENSNYSNNWRGEGLNDGTYFYILDVPDDKKYSGFLTIFGKN